MDSGGSSSGSQAAAQVRRLESSEHLTSGGRRRKGRCANCRLENHSQSSFVAFQDEEEISTSPGVSEFVSDAFDACNLNQEDLRKEMEQLVLDKKEEETAVLEGTRQTK